MKLNKKIMLSAFAGASAVGAITPALVTSVNANKLNVPNHVYQSEDDLKYGLDDSTYLEVKANFQEELAKLLKERQIEEGSAKWNKEMGSLKKSLASFDKISQSMNVSYTELTNSVITLARQDYNIPLRRTTNAKWSDITDMFNGTLNSVTLYMDHEHLPISTQRIVINDATNKFNLMLANLEQQNYKECDPYGAMIEVRKEMLSFFEMLSAKVAKISASMKLNRIISNYRISPKQNGKNYSELKDLVVGQPIANINEIVTFVDLTTGLEKTFEADRMIPGYVVTPRFGGFNVDKFKNAYSINIDWTATSNHYANTNEASAAEGHIYDTSNEEIQTIVKNANEIAKTSAAASTKQKIEVILKQLKPKLTSYQINESKTAESQSIIDTYFGENGLTFKFPTGLDTNARLEPFYNQLIDKEYIYHVPADLQDFVKSETLTLSNCGIALTKDLADAGLQVMEIINGQKVTRYMSEVLETIKSKKTEEFTLAEKFAANCKVYSLTRLENPIAIVDHNGQVNEKTNVKNEFYVAYANQFNNKVSVNDRDSIIEFIIRSKKSGDWTILPENKQPGTCVDYVTSEQYFFNLCEKFSAVSGMVDLYENTSKKLNELIDGWDDTRTYHITMCTTASIVGAATIGLLAQDVCCIFLGKNDVQLVIAIVLDVVSILLSSAVAGLAGYSSTLVKDKLINPLKELRDKMEKLFVDWSLGQGLEKVKQQIENDSKLVSLIKLDPKNAPEIIDKVDYDKKLQLYYKSEFKTYKNMYNFYSNFKWANVNGITVQDAANLNNYMKVLTTDWHSYMKEAFGTTVNFDGKSAKGYAKTSYTFGIIEIVGMGVNFVLHIARIILLANGTKWFTEFIADRQIFIAGAAYLIGFGGSYFVIAWSLIGNFSSFLDAYKNFNKTEWSSEDAIPQNIDLK